MLDATRELLSRLPVAILLMREPGVIVWANPRALTLLGMSLEQISDRLVLDIVHPEDRRQAATRVGIIISGDVAPPLLYRVLRPNGVTVEMTAESTTVDIDGETLIATILRDVATTA